MLPRRGSGPQQAPVEVHDPAVALAGGFLQALPVCHGDASTVLPDQPSGLERSDHHAHRRTLYAQHLGQELVSERQRVLLQLVAQHEEPTAAARLDRMYGIAGEKLERVREQDLGITSNLTGPFKGEPGSGHW